MANQSIVSANDGDDPSEDVEIPSLPPSGPRKLIRPSLPQGVVNRRPPPRRDGALLTHQHLSSATGNSHCANSHAEVFYLQKQQQAQTPMVLMLDDGQRIEGTIEWYDTDTIKVRHGSVRTLIYKSAIKYLHKAGNSHL